MGIIGGNDIALMVRSTDSHSRLRGSLGTNLATSAWRIFSEDESILCGEFVLTFLRSQIMTSTDGYAPYGAGKSTVVDSGSR